MFQYVSPIFRIVLLVTTLFTSLNLFSKSASTQKPVIRVIMLGDSLTAGYGVSQNQAFPNLLQKALQKKGHPEVKIVNAGISGSTSASALRRLRWQLKTAPKIVFLALGANDGLRGFKPEATYKNLASTIELAQSKKIKVLLAGMRMPPNYGKGYTKEFEKIFPRLAKKYKVKLIPFLLKGVAANSQLNQPDGIHPNEKGHKVIAETVRPYLEKML